MKSPSGLITFLALVLATANFAAEPERQIYKTIGDDTKLEIWIYKPEGWKAEDKRPAVVFYHGGGWSGGTPDQFDPHCQHFAKRGMVAFSVEYRLKSRHGSTPVENTQDAKSAFRWVRGHADELGVDPDRIAAGGGSAGGHLAAAIATVALNDPQDDQTVSAVPNSLMLFNPALNLDFPRMQERWGDLSAETIRSISPYQNVTKDLPPTIIFHGKADTTVPYSTVDDFTKKANELGAKVNLRGYEGRAHGFFNFKRSEDDYQATVAEAEAFLVELGWLSEIE